MSIQSVIMPNHENVSITPEKTGFCILATLTILMFFNKGRLAKQNVVIIDIRKGTCSRQHYGTRYKTEQNVVAISFIASIAGIDSCIIMFWLP